MNEGGTRALFEKTLFEQTMVPHLDSAYNLARWISSDDRAALAKFMDENRSAICDDVDGDPVFLATSAFMMRRAEELAPGLTFRDIKDVRAEKIAA